MRERRERREKRKKEEKKKKKKRKKKIDGPREPQKSCLLVSCFERIGVPQWRTYKCADLIMPAPIRPSFFQAESSVHKIGDVEL